MPLRSHRSSTARNETPISIRACCIFLTTTSVFAIDTSPQEVDRAVKSTFEDPALRDNLDSSTGGIAHRLRDPEGCRPVLQQARVGLPDPPLDEIYLPRAPDLHLPLPPVHRCLARGTWKPLRWQGPHDDALLGPEDRETAAAQHDASLRCRTTHARDHAEVRLVFVRTSTHPSFIT